MEPANIDWKRIDSRFVEDVFFEHFKAPKWFDFSAPHDDVDDDAWFCRPDCNHPKRAEDFLAASPATSKLRSGGEALSARHPKHSEAKPRRKAPFTSNNYDSENQNPNSSTPLPSHHAKSWRAALRSNSVKKTMNTHEKLQREDEPKLKSTLSARNLFHGKDILGHISELCNELKRLATRVTEREETVVKPNAEETLTQVGKSKEQRRPLLEVDKEKLDDVRGRVSSKKEEEGRRKKRVDDEENIIPMALDLEKVKNKGEELRLQQIKTNPPSPQCFSATKSASSRSKPMERRILQERVEREEERGRRGLDVLWFLKPCTLAS
ncbi:PREDICTED: uncharacterized protein LOC104826677 [Tarenaya hassleriana]|uniref:uncharacterized protein LOC104826677 n=1 Tax=Tarenaya hassleriana TaxID=28532 RepID=UPI00053C6B04|nr:PREDICTED: uncharacterized protein LOC104826677 [Tarenaya hassleriana]